MADVRHPGLRPPTGTQRRRFIFVVLIAGLVTAVGAIVLTGRSDPATTGAPSSSRSTTTLAVTTTIGEREEAVADSAPSLGCEIVRIESEMWAS